MPYLPFIISFASAIVLTPLIKLIAKKTGLIDQVDGDTLKIHKKPTPLLGGAVLVLSMIIGLIAYKIQFTEFKFSWIQISAIIISGLMIFTLGLIDDIKKLKPMDRLVVHIIAGAIIAMSFLLVYTIPIKDIAILITIFYLVFTINAYNFIDGMDGLCAGLSIITAAGFLVLGLASENALIIGLSGFLLASLIGFLPYNFNPAKIFLGDAGSGVIGVFVGILAVMCTFKPYDWQNFIGPVFIMGIPIFDALITIGRRLIKRKPLFQGDRSHIYDILLAKNLSQRRVWLILCIAQIISAAIGVMIYRA